MKRRALILLSVLAAYASTFAPERFVLERGLELLGNPPYEGWRGLFLPHLLLYSTLPAVVCAILWYLSYRGRLLPGIPSAHTGKAFLWGAGAGAASLLAILVVVASTMPRGTIHWIGLDPLKIFANVFSNFYEEFIFRGFLLTALTALISFWPAAIISSILWAAEHTQYPWALRLAIAAVGVLWCWIIKRTRSFLAAYEAHMLVDIFGDALIP